MLLRRPPEAESLPGYRFPGVWLPIQPGHETFGTIERLGPDAARRWKVRKGDPSGRALRHAVRAVQRLHARSPLRADPAGIGPVLRPYASGYPPGLWGGYGTHLYLAPTATVVPLDSSVDLRAAAFHNPLANGIW